MRCSDHAGETGVDAWEVGHYRPGGEWDLLITGSFDAMATLMNFLNGGLGTELPPDALR